MTIRYRDPVITAEGLADSLERQRAELAKDPQQAAMAAAHQATPEELASIADAEQRLREADVELNAAGIALSRARQGMAPEKIYDRKRPHSFFERQPATYKAALAAMPGLQADAAEARIKAQGARRRLNAIVRDVNRARSERRQAAKRKHTPKREPVQSRNDGWGNTRAMDKWSGGKGAV